MKATKPRPPRGALHRRLSAILISLSVALTLLVGASLWLSDTLIEDAAVRDLMERELSFLLGPHAPDAPADAHGALRFFTTATVPAELRRYTPGYYDHFRFDERSYNLLVRDTDAGDRAYLIYDVTFIEARERALIGAAVLFLGGLSLFSLFGARWLADRALAPLDALVAQIGALNPEQRGERLHLDTRDSELGVISDAVNRYTQALDAVIERERAFSSAASHELRTPIAVIQGAAETLALQGRPPALQRIERATMMLRHELDALLALSRLGEAPVYTPLALHDWLRELAEPYQQAAPATRVDWDVAAPVTLRAPPGAVAAIFTNLLRNALRAARDGRVLIRVRDDGFTIEDDGPGIAEADLPHLFEPGFRGHDGGSGMGLYISQALAQRLGWTLRLANRPQGGAIGTLRIAAPPA